MPAWLTAAFVGWFTRNVLATVGVGVVTFTGFDALLTHVGGLVRSNLSGMSGEFMGMLGFTGIDVAINMVLSAYAVKAAMRAIGRLGVLGKPT